jgi:hypothetical protein
VWLNRRNPASLRSAMTIFGGFIRTVRRAGAALWLRRGKPASLPRKIRLASLRHDDFLRVKKQLDATSRVVAAAGQARLRRWVVVQTRAVIRGRDG